MADLRHRIHLDLRDSSFGLTNGTGYIFAVEAVNSLGDGPFSTNTGTITPSGPPGAPTLTSLTPADGALVVNFTAPSSSAPILNYLYQLNGSGPFLPTGDATGPITISGLTDGSSYSVELEAVNSVGTGAASNSLSATPVAPTGSADDHLRPDRHRLGDGRLHPREHRRRDDHRLPLQPEWRQHLDDDVVNHRHDLAHRPFNATTYNFELEADNASGYGAPASTSITTPSVPGAITVSSISPETSHWR